MNNYWITILPASVSRIPFVALVNKKLIYITNQVQINRLLEQNLTPEDIKAHYLELRDGTTCIASTDLFSGNPRLNVDLIYGFISSYNQNKEFKVSEASIKLLDLKV